MHIRTAIEHGPVVLDGGLATTLEAAGHDLDTPLWSARLLTEEPAAVVAAHEAFLDAGAQVLLTASYQASIDGFVGHGMSRDDAGAAIRRSVELARRAIRRRRAHADDDTPRWVAGSVGPYGAALADGSEYTGGSVVDEQALRDFHEPRIAHLAEAGADLLAIETQPRLDEALVALRLARSHGMDAWVSFTTRDGEVLPDGTPVEAATGHVAAAGALAVGVNCCPPRAARRALASLVDVPATVAYPNLGARWDDTEAVWTPRDDLPDLPAADLVGGCCGTAPRDIAALVERLGRPT